MSNDGGVPRPDNRNAWHWYRNYVEARRDAERNSQFRDLYDVERGAHERTRQRLRDAIAGLNAIADGILPDGDHPNMPTIMHAEAVLTIVMRP